MGKKRVVKIDKITKLHKKSLLLPSSKALSIRALYLPFLGMDKVVIENIPDSDDFKTNLNIIKKMGLQVKQTNSRKIIIKNQHQTFNTQHLTLFAGDSGLGVRFLITLLSLMKINAKIIMSKQLAKRHVLADSKHLVGLGRLKQKGEILYVKSLKVTKFKSLKVQVGTNITSQYLSALLFFGWRFGIKKIKLTTKPISYSYVKTTIELLKLIGVKWTYNNRQFLLQYAKPKKYIKILLPPDASIASNFMVLSCILKEKIIIKNFKKSIIEPDFTILNTLREIGAQYRFKGNDLEFYGNIKKEYIEVDLKDNPDLLPPLTLLLLFLKRGGKLKNIEHTQFKESPRSEVLIRELSKLNVKILQDGRNLYVSGFKFQSFKVEKKVILDCYGDHRIFMAFAILGIVLDNISIKNPEAVRKSFPNFLNYL